MFARLYVIALISVLISFMYASIPAIHFEYSDGINLVELRKFQRAMIAEELTLYKDLQKYQHLDDQTRLQISKYVPFYAIKYGVKMEILYSVLWRETRFQHQTTHKATYIKSLKKTIEAKGIGGVVCEFWCDKLKAQGIINIENDLYNLEKGIESTAFILSELGDMPKLKGYTLEESVLHRYYGTPKESYYKQILGKADQIQNDYFKIISKI